MVGFVDLPTTQLAISRSLKDNATLPEVISKINEVIKKINFLDEHINFLYERSRTQYNTIIAVQKGLQKVYE
jgi:hypothetical protein